MFSADTGSEFSIQVLLRKLFLSSIIPVLLPGTHISLLECFREATETIIMR